MTPARRLQALAALAEAEREARLAALRQARTACATAAAELDALPPPAGLQDDPAAGARLAAARARWYEQARRRGSMALAAAHVAEEDARTAARRAFGRAEALRRLAARPPRR